MMIDHKERQAAREPLEVDRGRDPGKNGINDRKRRKGVIARSSSDSG